MFCAHDKAGVFCQHRCRLLHTFPRGAELRKNKQGECQLISRHLNKSLVFREAGSHHKRGLLVRVRLYDVRHLVVEGQVEFEVCLIGAAWEAKHQLPELHWPVALI